VDSSTFQDTIEAPDTIREQISKGTKKKNSASDDLGSTTQFIAT